MNFPLSYLTWHYSKAYQDITRIWLNYLWFTAHFFSLGILLKTFFEPFKRIKEKNDNGLDFKKILESLLINSLMRLVGILLRSVLISLGLSILITVFVIGLAFYILWTLFPLFLIGLLLLTFGLIKI